MSFSLLPAFAEIFNRGRYDITQFGRDFCDIDLHEGQREWVDTKPWAPERVLACSNRWGKTEIASVKLRHHALYQTRLPQYAHLTHDYTACALSLTLDMARIAWNKCYFGGLSHPLYSRFVVPAGAKDGSKLTPFPIMVIGDGGHGPGSFRSEIWARTTAREAQYLAGHNFDFINWDEPSRDAKGLQILDDILRMRLPDRDGRLDFTSTGNGRNWYFGLYNDALAKHKTDDPQYYARTGPVFENPFVSHDAVRRAEARMNPALARQNIYGGFADTGTTFPIDMVMACYSGIDYSFPEAPVRDGEYLGALDFGRLRDKTVMLVIRTDEANVVGLPTPRLVYAQEWGSESSWKDIFKGIREIFSRYNRAPLLGDATSMGGDVILDTLSEQYNVNIRGHQVGGSKEKRTQLLLRGQRAVQSQEIKWPFNPTTQILCDQLSYFDPVSKNQDDDWVMAFCLLALQRDLASKIRVARASAPHVYGGLTWVWDYVGKQEAVIW